MENQDNIFNSYDRNLYKLGYVPDSASAPEADISNNFNVSSPSNTLAGSDTGGAILPNPQDPEVSNSGTSTNTQQQTQNIQAGKTVFDNTETGYILGVKEGVTKFYIGNSTNFLNWTGTALNISGNITATTGTIGGFDIGTDYIRDTVNSFGLSSTVTGGDDVRFWAGATFANRAISPFRVTEAGVLTASSGTIGGSTLSATTLIVGTGSNAITINSSTGVISSNGSTWSVAGDGTLVGFGTKISTSASTTTVTSSGETTISSATVTANTLGTANAVRIRMYVKLTGSGAETTTFKCKYGSTTLVTGTTFTAASNDFVGLIEFTLFANAATNAQYGSFLQMLDYANSQASTEPNAVHQVGTGTATEDSTGALTISVTVTFSSTNQTLVVYGSTVEKIN